MEIEEFKGKLLEALLNLIGAPDNPEQRYSFFSNPSNLQTTTRLTKSQITFVTVAEWCAKDHPVEFAALGNWSRELCESVISDGGAGRDDIIRYEQSKRAVPSSSVNILGSLRDKADKAKKKIKGEESST
jgi:hypothetical protein